MNINWKVRAKNPLFWVEVALAILVPMAAYMGISMQEITSWNILWDLICSAIKNPYVLAIIAVSAYNAVNDPTTKGVSDSQQALTYQQPKEDRA